MIFIKMFSDLESAIAAYETMCSAHTLYVMRGKNECDQLEHDYLNEIKVLMNLSSSLKYELKNCQNRIDGLIDGKKKLKDEISKLIDENEDLIKENTKWKRLARMLQCKEYKKD